MLPSRFRADDALVRVLGFNTLFYVSFGIGAWVAALLTAIGAWGDESFALTLPWLVVVPSCFVAAFVTQPGRVERLAATTGSLPRRALGYAIAGTAWVRPLSPIRPPGGWSFRASSTVSGTSLACGRSCGPSERRCRCRSSFSPSPSARQR